VSTRSCYQLISSFSMITKKCIPSFHGFHVIIGTLFLIVCGIRQYLGHLTKKHHIGFEATAWYWHFVDVVRLFPFVSIYWWGGI
uniref:Cytochrome c oxidase subunit 3 n=1 Tax=Aegilops tauschii subsp. strangulata TaxID=200361 RepID=A0A453SD43_AEGTS